MTSCWNILTFQIGYCFMNSGQGLSSFCWNLLRIFIYKSKGNFWILKDKVWEDNYKTNNFVSQYFSFHLAKCNCKLLDWYVFLTVETFWDEWVSSPLNACISWLFFLSGFSFTAIHESQDCRGRGREFL